MPGSPSTKSSAVHRSRSGSPCQSPAVKEKARSRMRGGAKGSGAPDGQRNGVTCMADLRVRPCQSGACWPRPAAWSGRSGAPLALKREAGGSLTCGDCHYEAVVMKPTGALLASRADRRKLLPRYVVVAD